MVQVRYIVDDVEKAVAFYTGLLGFGLVRQFPAMAILARGPLELWVAGPAASASRPMPDGAQPVPGPRTASAQAARAPWRHER